VVFIKIHESFVKKNIQPKKVCLLGKKKGEQNIVLQKLLFLTTSSGFLLQVLKNLNGFFEFDHVKMYIPDIHMIDGREPL
jgi:hypothetical protein